MSSINPKYRSGVSSQRAGFGANVNKPPARLTLEPAALSADRPKPRLGGYWRAGVTRGNGRKKIHLDGEPVPGAIEADELAGFVEVAGSVRHDARGAIVGGQVGGRLHGRVEIIDVGDDGMCGYRR